MNSIDNDIVNEKLAEIARFIHELESVIGGGYDTFCSDVRNVRTAERDLELLVELASDVVGVYLTHRHEVPARSYRDAFERTKQIFSIPEDVSSALIELATLRNRLVHEYGEVYDQRLAYEGFCKASYVFKAFVTGVLRARE